MGLSNTLSSISYQYCVLSNLKFHDSSAVNAPVWFDDVWMPSTENNYN